MSGYPHPQPGYGYGPPSTAQPYGSTPSQPYGSDPGQPYAVPQPYGAPAAPYGVAQPYDHAKPPKENKPYDPSKPPKENKPYDPSKPQKEGKPMTGVGAQPYGSASPQSYGMSQPYGSDTAQPYGVPQSHGSAPAQPYGVPYGAAQPYDHAKPPKENKPYDPTKPPKEGQPMAGAAAQPYSSSSPQLYGSAQPYGLDPAQSYGGPQPYGSAPAAPYGAAQSYDHVKPPKENKPYDPSKPPKEGKPMAGAGAQPYGSAPPQHYVGGYSQPGPGAYGSPFASLMPSQFPPGTDPNVVSGFQAADQDGSGFIDDKELQRALSGYNQSFSLRTVHLLMYLFTNTNTQKIGPQEFTSVFYSLQSWRGIFERFDRDRSGKIDTRELNEALQSLGYSVSPVVLELLVSKYDKKGGKDKAIEYDNFIECCLTVKGLTEKFKEKDTMYSGSATFSYEVFMLTVLPFLIA